MNTNVLPLIYKYKECTLNVSEMAKSQDLEQIPFARIVAGFQNRPFLIGIKTSWTFCGFFCDLIFSIW